MEEAFAAARDGVPGPAFVECPVDLHYDEASIRDWYAEASGKGSSIPERLLRFYLRQHVARMLSASDEARPPRTSPKPRGRSSSSAARRWRWPPTLWAVS